MAYEGLMSQIANPQMADIAGALDFRQQRILEEQKRQKDEKMKELISQAIPGLRPGSVLSEMAAEDPERYMMFSKAMGIPMNEGDKIEQMAQDVRQISKIASRDPEGAMAFVNNLASEREQLGLDVTKLRQWQELATQDFGKAQRAISMLDESLNSDLINAEQMQEREMRVKEGSLALKEAGLGLKAQQLAMGGAAGGGQAPASIQEIEYYNSLPEGPEKEAVGRKLNMVSREGEKLSAYAEKQLDMASTDAAEASSAAGRYMTLADQIRSSAMSGGLKSSWTEYVKEQTGNQDEVTGLRKQAMQIVNSEAIKNLPPGPATDRDIEMVRAPFPTDKASPEYVANWLSAVARLNEKRAEFSEFKANFISENGSVRTKGGESLIASWRNQQGQPSSSPAATSQSGSNQAQKKTGGTEMVDANGNRAIVYPDGSFEEL